MPYQIRQYSFLTRSGTMDTTFPSISIAPLISQQVHKEPRESENKHLLLWDQAMLLHSNRGDNNATEL